MYAEETLFVEIGTRHDVRVPMRGDNISASTIGQCHVSSFIVGSEKCNYPPLVVAFPRNVDESSGLLVILGFSPVYIGGLDRKE